jgi:hypothetical protein
MADVVSESVSDVGFRTRIPIRIRMPIRMPIRILIRILIRMLTRTRMPHPQPLPEPAGMPERRPRTEADVIACRAVNRSRRTPSRIGYNAPSLPPERCLRVNQRGMREHNGTEPELVEEESRFTVRLFRGRRA